MKIFEEYLSGITNQEQRTRMEELLNWVSDKFPVLEPRIAWNQPMFTDHDTYIIGFSVSKQHISIAPEKYGIDHFSTDILEAGYGHSSNLFRIKWSEPINFSLLEKIISFIIEDKAECSTFWRK